MSCPYFCPTEALGGSALLPLGDCWAGLCHAEPAAPADPSDRMCCNLGYARGRCARFPADSSADAVRFTIADRNDDGIGLYYVIERDHHPYAHGPLQYHFTSGFAAPPGGLLERQAAAYIASYRRRQGAA